MRRRTTQIRESNIANNKRNLIMKTAMRILMKKGYNNATMRQIARSCHMTPGNLYNYVRSKKDILDKISADSRQAADMFKRDLAKSTESNIKDKLRSAICAFFSLCDADADRIVIVIRDYPSFKGGVQFGNVETQSFIEDFESLITIGIDEGIFYAKDPKFIAATIVFLGYDWATRRITLKGLYDLQAYTEQQTEMIINHILTKEALQ